MLTTSASPYIFAGSVPISATVPGDAWEPVPASSMDFMEIQSVSLPTPNCPSCFTSTITLNYKSVENANPVPTRYRDLGRTAVDFLAYQEISVHDL